MCSPFRRPSPSNTKIKSIPDVETLCKTRLTIAPRLDLAFKVRCHQTQIIRHPERHWHGHGANIRRRTKQKFKVNKILFCKYNMTVCFNSPQSSQMKYSLIATTKRLLLRGSKWIITQTKNIGSSRICQSE
jgi:hypothetical protein